MLSLGAMMEYLESNTAELTSLLEQLKYDDATILMDERVKHITQLVSHIKQQPITQAEVDSIYMVLSRQELFLKSLAMVHHQDISMKLARLGKMSKAELVYRVNSKG